MYNIGEMGSRGGNLDFLAMTLCWLGLTLAVLLPVVYGIRLWFVEAERKWSAWLSLTVWAAVSAAILIEFTLTRGPLHLLIVD